VPGKKISRAELLFGKMARPRRARITDKNYFSRADDASRFLPFFPFLDIHPERKREREGGGGGGGRQTDLAEWCLGRSWKYPMA
jgi:hypothetical protein